MFFHPYFFSDKETVQAQNILNKQKIDHMKNFKLIGLQPSTLEIPKLKIYAVCSSSLIVTCKWRAGVVRRRKIWLEGYFVICRKKDK